MENLETDHPLFPNPEFAQTPPLTITIERTNLVVGDGHGSKLPSMNVDSRWFLLHGIQGIATLSFDYWASGKK